MHYIYLFLLKYYSSTLKIKPVNQQIKLKTKVGMNQLIQLKKNFYYKAQNCGLKNYYQGNQV